MKARKRPVVIEYVKWDGTHKSTKEVLRFMGQKVTDDEATQKRFDEYVSICRDKGLGIRTLEGTMNASVGDFIIKGVNGEFYPCKPDIFEKSYELIAE